MGLFFRKRRTREEEIKEARRRNAERHEVWGIDFAPDISDDDPDKWMDELDEYLDDEDDW